MNTQAMNTAENYDWILSKINGRPAFTDVEIKHIFEQLREEFKDKDDVDGVEVMVTYNNYWVTATRHFDGHAANGGDHYMGIWEQEEVTDTDYLEVSSVYNPDKEEDDGECPVEVRRMNYFNRNQQY